MNKDEVIKLAEEAGFELIETSNGGFIVEDGYSDGSAIFSFANAIADQQREKCVAIIEAEKVDYATTKDLGDLAYNTALDHGIAAIRANKK